MRRGEVTTRADVNHNALTEEVESRLSRSLFPIEPLSKIERQLQYGCSKRAVLEPVGTPILRMSNMQPDGWDLSELKYVELTPSEIETWLLQRGDILFNRTNSKELVGKCEVFDQPGQWVFASYLMRLSVDENLALPQFVSAFLNGETGRLQIARDSRQIIGMTNINAEEIRSLQIPLPDLDTHRQLVATLDAARADRDDKATEADALVASLNDFILDALGLKIPKAPASDRPFAISLDVLQQDRIDADYHAPRFQQLRAAIEASNFDTQSLADICLPLISGFAAGRADQAEDGDGIPHLRPTNINSDGEITMVGTKFVPRDAVSDADFVQIGEVLFNNTNSALWVGKSAVFDSDVQCACSNHVTRLRLRDEDHQPVFISALINALRSIGYFSVLATNFNNQAGINAETLSALRIPVPPGSCQASIASEIEHRRAEARRLHKEARTGWERARSNFESALLGPVS